MVLLAGRTSSEKENGVPQQQSSTPLTGGMAASGVEGFGWGSRAWNLRLVPVLELHLVASHRLDLGLGLQLHLGPASGSVVEEPAPARPPARQPCCTLVGQRLQRLCFTAAAA